MALFIGLDYRKCSELVSKTAVASVFIFVFPPTKKKDLACF